MEDIEMSGNKNISEGKIAMALHIHLDTALNVPTPQLTVLPGVRNTKDNPKTVIFCNTPVALRDKGAIGSTLARVEIINKKQDSGIEQLETTRDSGDAIVRWGSIDLQDLVMDALFPEVDSNGNPKPVVDLLLDDYAFNLKDVRKQQDKDYIYIMVLLNCTILK